MLSEDQFRCIRTLVLEKENLEAVPLTERAYGHNERLALAYLGLAGWVRLLLAHVHELETKLAASETALGGQRQYDRFDWDRSEPT